MEEQKKQSFTDEAAERAAIMKRLESSNAAQERYAKKQYKMSLISAAANVTVLILVIFLVLTLMPKINATFEDLNAVMENVESITKELSEVDIEGMVSNIDDLVVGSSDSLTQAMKKLNAIDIEKLNDAIRNLNDAVEPMARFANLFK